MPTPKERTHAAAYAAHFAEVVRSRWRLGRVRGFWQIAQCGPATGGVWVVLDEQLKTFDDIDTMAERQRVVGWVYEVLGVRSVWLRLDLNARAEGREAYDVEIKR